ncbi:MAG: phosphatidylserine decarboxylase [Proteobacteria bacterium]|nr:phosphatidylserine decarboxylase [Pseudomonadota bacterium]
MTLAREGWGIVTATLFFTLILTWFAGWWSLPLWVLFLLVLQFFREPQRVINASENTVLSAADGRVVHIGQAPSPLDGSDKLKISVFMNVFNVHANRAPVAGEVTHSERFPGSFLNAALDKASAENERHLIAINSSGGEVLSMQIAGLLARRVLCYANTGKTLTIGERYGFIRFGSRVDLYLPLGCQPQVRLGDKTAAGITAVATLPLQENQTATEAVIK